MTVIEIARYCGITPNAVRYYVRKGLLNPEREPVNNYRRFSRSDIHAVRFILQAKRLGFSLKEITSIVTECQQGRSPCSMVRGILTQHIAENRAKLDDLLDLQGRMESTLEQWEKLPDRLPEGDTLCYLIESVSEAR